MSGVNTLSNSLLSLAHEFANEEDIGGGTVSDNIVLGYSSTPNHSCGGVLDLLRKFKWVMPRTPSYLPFRRATLFHPLLAWPDQRHQQAYSQSKMWETHTFKFQKVDMIDFSSLFWKLGKIQMIRRTFQFEIWSKTYILIVPFGPRFVLRTS